MWRKEDGRQPRPNEISTGPITSNVSPVVAPLDDKNFSPVTPVPPNPVSSISQGIRIKGEITGGEDLFIDGIIEGKVNFQASVLTVGPNATIKADVSAREIVVRGRVCGKLDGSERIAIHSSGRVDGDINSSRISVEEGAEIHGRMDVGKPPSRAAEAPVVKTTESVKPRETDSTAGKSAPDTALAGAD